MRSWRLEAWRSPDARLYRIDKTANRLADPGRHEDRPGDSRLYRIDKAANHLADPHVDRDRILLRPPRRRDLVGLSQGDPFGFPAPHHRRDGPDRLRHS